MVLPIKSKISKLQKLKIRVDKYEDYEKLTKNWPVDAFKNGIIVQKIKPKNELMINILNIDQKLKLSESEIIKIEKNNGLSNLKRIYKHDNSSSDRLVAKCNTIIDFIRILKYGIKIDENSNKHIVVPNIINYKVCQNCGGLNHREKDCRNYKKCLKCAKLAHSIENCEFNQVKCTNCSGDHFCFSDFCDKYAQKKFQINSFTLKILLGEKFIKNESDILIRNISLNSTNEFIQASEIPMAKDQIDLIKKCVQVSIKEKMSNFHTKCDHLESKFKLIEEQLERITEILLNEQISIRNVWNNLTRNLEKTKNDVELKQEEIDKQIYTILKLFNK
ncbi:unnamed protein product [Brachionus calyciflorus]|uniref:CCHC-type domain-containing protein n=1 Tax=Brachionus calyciflorus TaxID=104777 RepID=A0A813PJF4_9BILA|nr:unnamed protein product [Brachionus calyciflorus]